MTRNGDRCPRIDRLRADIPLGEAEQAELAQHLEVCAPCREALEREQQARLDGGLRGVFDGDEIAVSPPLSRLNALLTDYELLGELGRGGMGVVYRARQRSLDRLVAIKILPALLGTVRPDAAERFRREAALAGKLKHSNIIGVHDFGEAEGTLYYAMELIEGRTLADLLREFREAGGIEHAFRTGLSGTPPPAGASDRAAANEYFRTAARWVADVADAVQYAHDQGVLHRDLKPANLIVGADGRLLIGDFGLARPVTGASMTASRALLGTSRYMSPERVDPTLGPVDSRADVYALGATLYEIITLRPVFEGADDREILHRVVRAEPVAPSAVVRLVPRGLETVCLKALAKRPADRYGSASEFGEDLRRWLLGLPVLARRPGMAVRAVRYVRRRKVAALLASALVLSGTAAAVLAVDAARSRQRAADAAKERASLLFLEANEAYQNARYEAASDLANDALALRPGWTNVLRFRAWVRHLQGDTVGARAAMETLLERDPDDWESRFTLARLLHELDEPGATEQYAAVERLAPDTFKAFLARACMEPDAARALEFLDRADELDPERTETLYYRGKLLAELGRDEEHLVVAQKLTAKRPNSSLAQGELGFALLGVGRLADAETAYTRAIEINPTNPVYWANRASARYERGDADGALADARRAFELDPEFAQAWLVLARAQALGGDTESAIATLGEAIRHDPRGVEAYLQRSALYYERGDTEAMAADASRVIQLAPDDPRGYQNRLAAMRRLGKTERALQDAARCVKLAPEDPVYHRNYAILLGELGRPAEAVEAYSRAIALRPTEALWIGGRAAQWFRIGRPERAAADAVRALELDPSLRLVAVMAATAYWELGLGELALASLDDAEGADRDGPLGEYAPLLRFLILTDLGRTDDAQRALREDPLVAGGSAGWASRIATMLLGDVERDDLIASAATSDERAEALFYAGTHALLTSDKGTGHRLLEECVALKRDVLETDFARSLLRRLEKGDRRQTPHLPPKDG